MSLLHNDNESIVSTPLDCVVSLNRTIKSWALRRTRRDVAALDKKKDFVLLFFFGSFRTVRAGPLGRGRLRRGALATGAGGGGHRTPPARHGELCEAGGAAARPGRHRHGRPAAPAVPARGLPPKVVAQGLPAAHVLPGASTSSSSSSTSSSKSFRFCFCFFVFFRWGQFSDVLLYTNRTSGPQLQFKVHGQLPLRGVMVEDSEPKMGNEFCFTIYGGNR